MKKFLSTLLVGCLSIGMFSGTAFAVDAPKILINGSEPQLETASMIKEGRTWVSMSSILTTLGYDVSWDAATKTSTVFDKTTGIKAQFSETTKNVPYTQTGIDKVAVLNEAPFVKNGRTYLQLNVFADIFCKNISYNEASNTVILDDAYGDDLFEIEETVSGPITLGQNFKINVSTDGSYEWIVSPNANFSYYGMVAEGVGNYSMYFKALAYQTNDKITLQKINSDTGKVVSEKVYSVVVSNRGIEETPATKTTTSDTIVLENGEINTAKVGDIVQINLDQNASTGYEWKTTVPDGLQFEDKTVVTPQDALTGSPSKAIWTFKVLKTGKYELKFDYSRSWETQEPAKSANYVIEVK